MRKLYILICSAITLMLPVIIKAQVTKLYTPAAGGITLNSKVIFLDGLGNLGATDGTVAGTSIIVTSSTVNLLPSLANAIWNNKLYFVGNEAAHGNELWVTDATTAGTILLKDINPGTANSFDANSSVRSFEVVNNIVYFVADDGIHGTELWKTDGTAAGTVMVKDINPGIASSNIQFTHPTSNNYGSTFYFTANDGTNGQELWKSDGTTAGTVMVANITPGSASSTFGDFIIVTIGNYSFFVVNDGTHGYEIWRTDGTEIGTILLKDINLGSGSSFGFLTNTSLETLRNYLVFNNKLYFLPSTGSSNYGLWVTDGTTTGTTQINSTITDLSSNESNSAVILNGKFYFATGTNTGNVGIWQSDGTAAGTQLFKDFTNGNVPNPQILLPGINNNDGALQHPFQGTKFFFTAYDAITLGVQLWISDGTLAGTQKLIINPTGNAIDQNTVRHFFTEDRLFITATNGTNGYELWKSDGTQAGTVMVKDINVGINSSNVDFCGVASSNTLVFTASDGTATNLYKADASVVLLPVTLANFKALLSSNNVSLQWQTLQEINSATFVIQRSTDGIHFSTIGNVAAAGNSASITNYTFIDYTANTLSSSTKLFYRLQSIDKDGSSNFSSVETVLLSTQTLSLTIFPNPAKNIMYVQGNNLKEVSIANTTGKILIKQLGIDNGRTSINISGLTPGFYIVTAITTHGNSQTSSVVIQK